jgi:hypothetical protein
VRSAARLLVPSPAGRRSSSPVAPLQSSTEWPGEISSARGAVETAQVDALDEHSVTHVAWRTTFIIDPWFTGIIVAGLAASWMWRRSRVPAVAVLGSYVGMQVVQRERAIDFGERHAAHRDFVGAQVSAISRPVSPFNWMVMVTKDNRYHYAEDGRGMDLG